MKKYSLILLLSTIAVASFSTSARTQETETNVESEDVASLDATTCREILLSSGDNRSNSLIFMHGYINGKKGELVVDAPALADITQQVINTCIDNPDRSVLEVMEEARQ